MTGGRPRRTPCRSCGGLIFWAMTEQGKKMPVDDEPDPAGNLLLTPGPHPKVTVVSRGGQAPVTTLYRSHFATCKKVDRHRAAPKPQPVAPAMPQQGLFQEPPSPAPQECDSEPNEAAR
jgi:hypothetical protein